MIRIVCLFFCILVTAVVADGLVRGVPGRQPQAEILWTKPICQESKRFVVGPTLCRLRSGELLVAFSGNRDGHVCPWGRVEIVRSKDGGETWSDPVFAFDGVLDDRDVGIFELDDGTLLLNWSSSIAFRNLNVVYRRHYEKLPHASVRKACGYFSARSTDGGKVWEPPVRTYGGTSHGGIQLKDGRILVIGRHGDAPSAGLVHPTDPEFGCVPYRLVAEVSEDRGKTWKVLSDILPQAPYDIHQFHEPHLVECPDGRICAFFRCHRDGVHITQCDSLDGGKTWGPMRDLPMKGARSPHLMKLADGRLLLTYATRGKATEVCAVVSADGGRTWGGCEIRLSSVPDGDTGQPSSCLLADGTIMTVYCQSEEPIKRPRLLMTKWRLK